MAPITKMALLWSVDVRVAPLRLCFYLLFYVFLLSLFTRITSALIIYDKRTLLDIGHHYTNLLQDILSTDPTWPLAILRNTEENKGHLNNPRISPLFAAHSICPGSFHRSLLLLFTFHHRQTLAWLCPNSTMSSAATSTNTLTLPLSSRGTLTKPTLGRSCRTFTNMYPVQLGDRIHWIIARGGK